MGSLSTKTAVLCSNRAWRSSVAAGCEKACVRTELNRRCFEDEPTTGASAIHDEPQRLRVVIDPTSFSTNVDDAINEDAAPATELRRTTAEAGFSVGPLLCADNSASIAAPDKLGPTWLYPPRCPRCRR